MIYKTGKCKCCGKNYSIVNWIKSREYSFCNYDHAKQYVLTGFVDPAKF